MTDEELRHRAGPIIEQAMSQDGVIDEIRTSANLDSPHIVAAILRDFEAGLERNDPTAFALAVAVCADTLRSDTPVLPGYLARFAADVLDGSRMRPKVRGHDPLKAPEQDFLITRAIDALVRELGVPRLTNNELSHKLTAAQLVAEQLGKSLDQIKGAYRREQARAKKEHGGKVKAKTRPQD